MAEATRLEGAAASVRIDSVRAVAMRRGDAQLQALAASLGFEAGHDFKARSALNDEFGMMHVRFDQYYRGVRVWQGEAIVELSAQAAPLSVIHTLQPVAMLSVVPSLNETEVLRLVQDDLRPQGPYASAPVVELVVYPMLREQVRPERLRGPDGELNALDVEHVPADYALAYHVHTALENGEYETRHTDYIIDAHGGAILKKWSTLYTAAEVGNGQSQHSGIIPLDTSSVPAGDLYELRDISRGMEISTYDLGHGTMGMGNLFTDLDNDWGNGTNYKAGSPTYGANGQTAAVDAHYGAERTFDYYSNVHGRNGIDGLGSATYSRVHYANNYDNAFWDDTCFCMTYGDGGRRFKVLTSLDIAGHEMTHGVISSTARLTYSGESGGLNESMADIFGTMIEFYVRGGSGSIIGDTGGNWSIGEQLAALPLRYMDKPSKDKVSRDAWSSGIGAIDPHYSSGPMNRAFYFLSHGASKVVTDDSYSPYLPGGMTGIGNTKAAKIAYYALLHKMTSSTNYAGARSAFLAAADTLYGKVGLEYAAVEKAFAAINVGLSGGDTTPPVAQITSPADGDVCIDDAILIEASARDNVGVAKVLFLYDNKPIGMLSALPYRVLLDTKPLANGTYNLTVRAFDAAGNVGTSPAVKVKIDRVNPICAPEEDYRCKHPQPRPDRFRVARLE